MGLDSNDILQGNIFKGIIKLSLPLMFLNLINTVYSLVDTFFVGRIGELNVGAVALVAPVINCANACVMGLCAAAVSLIARALGERNKAKATRIANHILVFGCFLGICMGALCICIGKDILIWLKTPDDIFNESYKYLIGLSFDFLFLFIISIFQSIKQASGETKVGVLLNVLACLGNCILDPIFIFVFKLGILGAALATTTSKALMAPIAFYILSRKDQQVCIDRNILHINFGLIRRIIVIAIPAALGSFLSSFGFLLMNKAIVSYGAVIMSAYGVGNQISSLFYIPLNGIGNSLTTYIGQTLGDNNPQRAKDSYRSAIVLTAIISGIFMLVGALCVKDAIALFVKNGSELMLKEALTYAQYSIFSAFFMGWFNALMGVFNGSGNTFISMLLSSIRLWVIRVPLIYLLGQFTSLNHIGIWWAMIISNAVTCVVAQILYMKYPWTTKGIKV